MINVTLTNQEFKHEGTHNNRSYDSLRVKSISNGRIYFTIIKDQMKLSTMAKQMKLEDGNVYVSFGKEGKLFIGTYSDDSITIEDTKEDIEEEVEMEYNNDKTITNNEILFTCKADIQNREREVSLSLHKQSYSDGTCFYTLQDRRGNWKVEHGSKNLSELIKQMEHELRIEQEYKTSKDIMNNEVVRKIYEAIEQRNKDIITQMKMIDESIEEAAVTTNSNHTHSFNSYNTTVLSGSYWAKDVSKHTAKYTELKDIEVMDNITIDSLINNGYNFWIKIVNENPYFNNDCYLVDLYLSYINKPITVYINKDHYNVITGNKYKDKVI